MYMYVCNSFHVIVLKMLNTRIPTSDLSNSEGTASDIDMKTILNWTHRLPLFISTYCKLLYFIRSRQCLNAH